MTRRRVVALILVTSSVLIISFFAWQQVTPQVANAAVSNQINNSWLGIRDSNVFQEHLYYDEKTEAWSWNQVVAANLTVRVFDQHYYSGLDEITIAATLKAQKNTTGTSGHFDLSALGFRVHSDNDSEEYVNFDQFEGQNVEFQKPQVSGGSAKANTKSEIGNGPTNASFTAFFKWTFSDYGKQVNERTLNITAETYYTEPQWMGTKTWFISTSIELNLTRGQRFWEEDFEGGGQTPRSWNVSDANQEKGFWGITESKAYEGSHSVWCDVGGMGGYKQYEADMNASMEMDLRQSMLYYQVSSKFSRLYLEFKAWVDTQADHDYLYVEYCDSNSSSWQTAAAYSGPLSTSLEQSGDPNSWGWLGLRLELPTSVTQLRFRFCSDGAPSGQGVYLDNIFLWGLPIQ